MPNVSGTLAPVAVALGEIVSEVRPVVALVVIAVTVVLAAMPGPVTAMPTRMPAVDDRLVIWLLALVVLAVTLAPVAKLPSDRLNNPAALVENVIVCTSLVPVLTTE